MLEGISKDARVRDSHLWHQILKMDADKQETFLHRVLHLHAIAMRRGGKSFSPRLSAAEWEKEIERCCFLGHCLVYMQREANVDGAPKLPA